MTSTTRPQMPSNKPGWALTRLIKLHDGIRADLDLLRRAGAAVAQAGDGDAAANILAQLSLRKPEWTLRRFCAGFCGFVHEHHATEDAVVFPMVLQHANGRDGELAAVVEKLKADHRTLAGYLDAVEQAFTRLPGDAAAKADATAAIDTLVGHLEAHLAYEETQLAPVLNALSEVVSETDVPPPPHYSISGPANT